MSAAKRLGVDDQEIVTIELLWARIRELEFINAALLAELRALKGPTAPPGWVAPKQAAALAGCSRSLVYKRCRNGLLRSCKVRARIAIDPASLRKSAV